MFRLSFLKYCINIALLGYVFLSFSSKVFAIVYAPDVGKCKAFYSLATVHSR
jgi:hypothetical protein